MGVSLAACTCCCCCCCPQAAIQQLVTDSVGDRNFGKAAACLAALRAACVEQRQGRQFNSWLEHLRGVFQGQGDKGGFWALLMKQRVAPVSEEEVAGCGMSAAAAEAYVREHSGAPAAGEVGEAAVRGWGCGRLPVYGKGRAATADPLAERWCCHKPCLVGAGACQLPLPLCAPAGLLMFATVTLAVAADFCYSVDSNVSHLGGAVCAATPACCGPYTAPVVRKLCRLNAACPVVLMCPQCRPLHQLLSRNRKRTTLLAWSEGWELWQDVWVVCSKLLGCV